MLAVALPWCSSWLLIPSFWHNLLKITRARRLPALWHLGELTAAHILISSVCHRRSKGVVRMQESAPTRWCSCSSSWPTSCSNSSCVTMTSDIHLWTAPARLHPHSCPSRHAWHWLAQAGSQLLGCHGPPHQLLQEQGGPNPCWPSYSLQVSANHGL